MPPTAVGTSISVNLASQAPPVRFLRVWLLALLIFGASISTLEAYWRSHGFRPMVPDSKDLWYFWRQRVYRDDGKVIVLLGASRMHADISVPVLQRLCPDYRVVQLAAFGKGSPLAILEDLVREAASLGLCSLTWSHHLSRLCE